MLVAQRTLPSFRTLHLHKKLNKRLSGLERAVLSSLLILLYIGFQILLLIIKEIHFLLNQE